MNNKNTKNKNISIVIPACRESRAKISCLGALARKLCNIGADACLFDKFLWDSAHRRERAVSSLLENKRATEMISGASQAGMTQAMVTIR